MEGDFLSTYIAELNKGIAPDPNEEVFTSIWNEYERVIVQSLITSFGLDFFIKDQHGGDVDTIHNVRQIGKDPKMQYKNKQNQAAYENRGEYNTREYHQDPRFKSINKDISESKKNGTLVDAYTGKKVARNGKTDLDHVVAAKEIHDDPGRVLAGLKGTDLANTKENLKATNSSINRSMQDKPMEEYIQKWENERPQRLSEIEKLKSKDTLSDKERKKLAKLENLEQFDPKKAREENRKARAAYNSKINRAYYGGVKFLTDAGVAAGKLGVKMGLRQALGVFFSEVYMTIKEKILAIPAGRKMTEMLKAVGAGVKEGFERAMKKYKEILSGLGEGFISGMLTSLTTTITNIFFTTAENFIKCGREMTTALIGAGKVLLFNPDNLEYGDRVKKATIIIGTGASVLLGTAVAELINKTPIGSIPGVGPAVVTFCSSLISGLLSCTLLMFLDRSKFIKKVIDMLNNFSAGVQDFKRIADEMERIAAQVAKYDLDKFKEETKKFNDVAIKIESVNSEEELNNVLLSAYKEFNINLPWKGDFDTFMGNKENHLVFE